ncbi:MAG: AAA family ATPase [Nitrospira sp.]|nr:AAA family ATPase [Nitrospira sp.]MCP9443053.1 AAA family ATPase [Nitrospira sp.]
MRISDAHIVGLQKFSSGLAAAQGGPTVRSDNSLTAGPEMQRDGVISYNHDQRKRHAQRLVIRLPAPSVGPHIHLAELITRAATAHKERAVVLVNEYDKPLLDNLMAPEFARGSAGAGAAG